MKIVIKFPLDHKFVFEEPSASLVDTVSSTGKTANFWTLLTVSLAQDANIVGFGMPFSSPDNELNDIVDPKKLKPIVDGINLVDLCRSRDFRILVQRPVNPMRDSEWLPHLLDPAHNLPYGDDHSWDDERDVDKFKKILADNKKATQYRPSTSQVAPQLLPSLLNTNLCSGSKMTTICRPS